MVIWYPLQYILMDISITSADAYHYYPDYATIKLYDSNSNLLDTQSVSLSPTSGTQTF